MRGMTAASGPPSTNPIQDIEHQFGFTLPHLIYAVLIVLAVLTALVVLYKPLGEFLGKIARLAAKVHNSLRTASKRANRRAMFADHLESAMRRLAEKEEWRDSRFAELEAEVEVERRSSLDRLRKRFGAGRTRIRRLPSLTAALRESPERLVVLEGDPGAGKSVALRHLAQTMAAAASTSRSERSILPIYVNLKTFRPSGAPTAEDVREYVLASMNPAQSRDIDRFLDDEFDPSRENGLLLFLFDSFDEIPAILSAVEAGPIIDGYGDAISGFIGMGRSRGIIASREFRGPGRTGWPRFRVMPLSTKRRTLLIRRADLDDADETLLLNGLGEMEPTVQQLADNPLFLSLLCEYVRERHALPTSTHAVMESYLGSRLARDRDRIEHRFAVTIDVTRTVAEEMAFQMLSSPEAGLSAGRLEIAGLVAAQLAHDPDEVVAAVDALIYSKLVKFSDDDAPGSTEDAPVTFAHRRIQEYFATCVAIRSRDRISLAELLTNGRWRETAVAMLQTAADSGELVAEIDALLQAAVPGESEWPPGSLHLLDILANGLRLEPGVELPVNLAADVLLARGWTQGTRLDRKWVVELCAAAGLERAIGYLTLAFDSGSLLLRDEAYAQVRRVGPAASRLEPQIRQALVDMSVDGELRRERRSVSAQLHRLADPRSLRRTTNLLLIAPVVSVIATAALTVAAVLTRWPFTFVALLSGAAVTFIRLSLASDAKVAHHAFRVTGWSVGDKTMANLLSLYLAGTQLVTVVFLTRGNSPHLLSVAVVGYVILWSYGALRSAAHDTWRSTWLLPFLPAYLLAPLPRNTVTVVSRLLRRPVRAFVALCIGFAVPATLILALLSGNVLALDIAVGLSALFGVAFCGIILFVLVTVRRDARQDRRLIKAFALLDAIDVPALQEVLADLHRIRGTRPVFDVLRRRELHRDPKIAEFLEFLAQRFAESPVEHPGRIGASGGPPTPSNRGTHR